MTEAPESTVEHRRVLAHRLLVDEFVDGLAMGPRTLISTPGYGLDESRPLVDVVGRLCEDTGNVLLCGLLQVLEGNLDIQPLAEEVLQAMANQHAAVQVVLLEASGFFKEGA